MLASLFIRSPPSVRPITMNFLLFLFIFSASVLSSLAQDAQLQASPATDIGEAAAVFEVLQGINYEIDWKSMFPGDPCTGGPHGLVCEVDTSSNIYHVVELNLGWVSDYINNPPCGSNASMHPSILKFSRLRKLFFYKCFVHSPVFIPPALSQLAGSLEHLTFQNNPSLVGPIPAELGNLTSLERLVLTENAMEGQIPTSLGKLKNLKQLVLSHNRLSSGVPRTLGGLDSLVILDLSGNQLVGSIPSSVFSLKHLQKLDLSHNLLEGPIDDTISNLQSLKFLDMSYNNLSGSVPDALGNISSVENLFLGNNLLGGTLPNIWNNLNNLIALGLSSSRYAGPIPPSIGELSKLNSLSLDGNQLSGPIPPSVGSLPNLYHMNLSSNQLVGPVPFTPSLVGRLGRNLSFKNNTGLCYHLELQKALPESLDLLPCPPAPASDGEFSTGLPVPSGSGAAGSNVGSRMGAGCLVWLLLLQQVHG